MSDTDLEEREQSAKPESIEGGLGADEQAKLDQIEAGLKDGSGNDDSIPYSPDSKQKQKFWTKRKKGAGIVAVVGGTSIIGLWSIIGPGLAVNHLRALLIEKISQVQVDHTRKYRQAKLSKVSDMFSSDGRRGGKIIAEMESRGYRFAFDKTDKNKIRGLTLPGQTGSIPNLDNGVLASHIEGFIEVHHPLRFSRWKTKGMEAFFTRYKISRKSITTRTSIEIDEPGRHVNGELIKQTEGEPEYRTTGQSNAPDGETDDEKVAREALEADRLQVAKGDGSLAELKSKLRAGTPIEELNVEERALLKISSRVDQEVIDILEKIYTRSIASAAIGSVKTIAASTDILDKICITKNRLRAISFAARNYRALSLIRYASVFIKAGDDVRTGTPDPKLLNELMKRTTATDANGNSIGGSPGFAYIIKNRFSKSQNDASKGNISVDGVLTGVPGALQDGTDTIPAVSRRQCGVYQNPAFQVAVGVIEIGLAVFSGGGTAAGGLAGKATVKQAVQKSLNNILTRQTAKTLLRSAAYSAAIEISFEGALTLLQFYSEKANTLNFTGQEKGGELGDILTAGSGGLNKQRSLQAGMVPATAEQYVQAHEQYIASRKQEQSKMSLYDRVANYDNTDSVAFQAMTRVVTSPMDAKGASIGIQNGVANAASLISSPFKLFGNIFSGSANAQSDDEIAFERFETKGMTLATDPAGNLLPIMRQDILDIDPEDNETYLVNSGDIDAVDKEPKSDSFKKHVQNCVTSVDTLSTIENEDQSNPKFDCMATQALTKKFKAHLAWMDMLDGVDASLFPDEIASGSSSTSTPDASQAVVGNTSDIPCAAGTTDAGEADGYSVGKKYIIRLCEIPGFKSNSSEDVNDLVRVNSTASGKWLQLFSSSQGAGITLVANSSFRTMAKQQSLYGCFKSGDCNGGNEAARPGFSNHQIGFAIDIDIAPGKDPSLTSCKSSPDSYPTYKWLAGNAPAIGIDAKVLSECWHWSVGGN